MGEKVLNDETKGILFKLMQYLKLNHRDLHNSSEFAAGMCVGFSTLWGFAKNLSLEKPRQPGVEIARDDVEWFYSVIDALAQWDGQALPVYPNGNDIEVERLFAHLNFFQNPDQILQDASSDLEGLIEKDSFDVRLLEKTENPQSVIDLDEICIIRHTDGSYYLGVSKPETHGYTYQEILLNRSDVYQEKLMSVLDLLYNKKIIQFDGEFFPENALFEPETKSFVGEFYTLLGRIVAAQGGEVSSLRQSKQTFSMVAVVGQQQLISLLPEIAKENAIVLLGANDHMTAVIAHKGYYYYFNAEDPNAIVATDLNADYRASEKVLTLNEAARRIFEASSTDLDAQLVLKVSVFDWHKSHCYVNKTNLLSDEKYCAQIIEPNKPSVSQNTPILEAVRLGDLDSLDYWLRQTGDSVNTQNYMGFSPLFLAAQKNKVSVVDAILKAENVNVNLTSEECGQSTPLFIAAQNGNLEVVKKLMQYPKIDPNICVAPYQATPFFIAAFSGQTAVVEELLKHTSVNPNQSTFEGLTPLGGAVKKGHVDVVKLLLASDKVDSKKSGKDGDVFYLVCKNRDKVMIDLFLARDLTLIKTGVEFLQENGPVHSKALVAVKKLLSDKVIDKLGESSVVLQIGLLLQSFGYELQNYENVMPEVLFMQKSIAEYCSKLGEAINTASAITLGYFSEIIAGVEQIKAAIEEGYVSMLPKCR